MGLLQGISRGAIVAVLMSLVEASPIVHASTKSQLQNVDMMTASTLDISDSYLITLKSGVDVFDHMRQLEVIHNAAIQARADTVMFRGVIHQYNISGFQGYAGHFDKAVVDQLEADKDVEAIEGDQIWRLRGLETSTRSTPVVQQRVNYGLAHISHRKSTGIMDSYVYDPSAGSGTYAYIIDSGINSKHVDFEGRAARGYNAITKKMAGFDDTDGHGTNMAGIIGSKTYGVAKKCNMISVKVLEAREARMIDIFAGYDWAVKDIIRRRCAAKSVIAVALRSSTAATAWAKTVDAASAQGISTVQPAGDDGKDLKSKRTPPLPETAVKVSATGKDRKKTDFANWGSEVDIFAPGHSIVTTNKGGDQARAAGSGTSYAAAFVSGLVVYFKALKNLDTAQSTKDYLLKQAIPNSVEYQGGKGAFAYNGSGR